MSDIFKLESEYNKLMEKKRAKSDSISKSISADEKVIKEITAKMDSKISELSPEEYISLSMDLDRAKLTKEMHEKQLSDSMGGNFKGFESEIQREQFEKKIRDAYMADEAEFEDEARKHLEELKKILEDRSKTNSVAMSLAQKVGGMSSISVGQIRTLIQTMISRYDNVKSFEKNINKG